MINTNTLLSFKEKLDGTKDALRDVIDKLFMQFDGVYSEQDAAYKKLKDISDRATLLSMGAAVFGNAAALERELKNLIDNVAEKYTSHGAPVRQGAPGVAVTVTQHQEQSQSLYVLLETIKSSLTPAQLQLLKDAAGTEVEPERKKGKIIETLKSFGGDVASNIAANILTNPLIWSGLF